MTHLILAAVTGNVTFISQYGPLMAAAVALFGVLMTLVVNVRRDQVRYRNEREDDYIRDQRTAIAAVVVAGHNFRSECAALINVDQWHIHRESADAATAALLNELTVARILVYDKSLQEALDGVFKAWDTVCEAVDMLEAERLSQEGARSVAIESLKDSLQGFDRQADILHTVTLKTLKPTVVKAS